MSLHARNLALLDAHTIPYREVSHEAVLDCCRNCRTESCTTVPIDAALGAGLRLG